MPSLGFKSQRYTGSGTSLIHTLDPGEAVLADDIIFVVVWRGNATTTGTQTTPTISGGGWQVLEHHEPVSSYRVIGTVLAKEAVGGETDLTIDWATADGESNQVVSSWLVRGGNITTAGASLTTFSNTNWTYPADQPVANNFHVGATQENEDISSTMYPAGDTDITHSAIGYRNGGVSVSGGATTATTVTTQNAGCGTVWIDDAAAGSSTSVTTYSEAQRITPLTDLRVWDIDVTYAGN